MLLKNWLYSVASAVDKYFDKGRALYIEFYFPNILLATELA